MAPNPLANLSDTAKGVIGGAGGAVVADVTVGLERATQAAGDVLTGIFNAMPWDMTASEIVDAVGGQGADAAGAAAPYILEFAGVLL